MKSNISIIRVVRFFIVLCLFSSCGSNLLLTKKDYRHLDLVKVESSEIRFAEFSQISEEPEEVHTFIDLDEQDLAYTKAFLNDPFSELEKLFAENGNKLPDNPLLSLIKDDFSEHLTSGHRVIIPDRETRKVIRQIRKGQDHLIRAGTEDLTKEKSSMFNIIRLLLYILIALLVITILGLVLPGYLVTIIVLVLLILALLYLLGQNI